MGRNRPAEFGDQRAPAMQKLLSFMLAHREQLHRRRRESLRRLIQVGGYRVLPGPAAGSQRQPEAHGEMPRRQLLFNGLTEPPQAAVLGTFPGGDFHHLPAHLPAGKPPLPSDLQRIQRTVGLQGRFQRRG